MAESVLTGARRWADEMASVYGGTEAEAVERYATINRTAIERFALEPRACVLRIRAEIAAIRAGVLDGTRFALTETI